MAEFSIAADRSLGCVMLYSLYDLCRSAHSALAPYYPFHHGSQDPIEQPTGQCPTEAVRSTGAWIGG